MNMSHQRLWSLHFIAPTLSKLAISPSQNCIFFLPHEFFYFSSQKEKQKMLGANGGPAISPHNPLWCPFAIDQILSTLQFSMQAKNKGGEHPLRQCVTRR